MNPRFLHTNLRQNEEEKWDQNSAHNIFAANACFLHPVASAGRHSKKTLPIFSQIDHGARKSATSGRRPNLSTPLPLTT